MTGGDGTKGAAPRDGLNDNVGRRSVSGGTGMTSVLILAAGVEGI